MSPSDSAFENCGFLVMKQASPLIREPQPHHLFKWSKYLFIFHEKTDLTMITLLGCTIFYCGTTWIYHPASGNQWQLILLGRALTQKMLSESWWQQKSPHHRGGILYIHGGQLFFFRKVSRASKSSVRALPERGFHKISNHSSQSSGEVSDGESLDHLCWLVYGTPNIRKVYGGCINLWFFNRSRTSIPKRKGALHQRVSRNYGLNKGFRNHWPEPTNFFDSFRDGIFPNIAYLFRKISCHFFPGIFLTGLNFLPKQKSTKRLIHRILVWHIYQDVPSKSANYR